MTNPADLPNVVIEFVRISVVVSRLTGAIWQESSAREIVKSEKERPVRNSRARDR